MRKSYRREVAGNGMLHGKSPPSLSFASVYRTGKKAASQKTFSLEIRTFFSHFLHSFASPPSRCRVQHSPALWAKLSEVCRQIPPPPSYLRCSVMILIPPPFLSSSYYILAGHPSSRLPCLHVLSKPRRR